MQRGVNLPTEISNLAGSSRQTVERLRGQIRQVETSRRPDDGAVVPTGAAVLDEMIPGGGYSRGTIVEWLANRACGADWLSLIAARNATVDGGALVVIDDQGDFYPPAAHALGIRLANVVVIRSAEKGPDQHLAPESPGYGSEKTESFGSLDADDQCWAIDQSLRCSAVAAVWGRLPEFETTHAERTWLRRFQLSAEQSGSIGFFLRSQCRTNSSWSEIQWKIDPKSSAADRRILSAKLTRCQGGIAGRTVDLEINLSTGNVQEHVPNSRPAHSLPLAAKLARPATRRRSERA